ncbi:hypothetical protein [Streptomyces sp. 1222.5]|uniref:hypothetical protein n=1 Tax=Streptomyces sp. 1222.5 TaxID=1881026 RepID=UPI003D75DD6C
MAAELFGIAQPTVSRYATLLRPAVRDSPKQLGFGIARLPRGELALVDRFLAPCCDWNAAEQLFSAKDHRTGHIIQVFAGLRGRLGPWANPCPAPATTPTPI